MIIRLQLVELLIGNGLNLQEEILLFQNKICFNCHNFGYVTCYCRNGFGKSPRNHNKRMNTLIKKNKKTIWNFGQKNKSKRRKNLFLCIIHKRHQWELTKWKVIRGSSKHLVFIPELRYDPEVCCSVLIWIMSCQKKDSVLNNQ